MALARMGKPSSGNKLYQKLEQLNWDSLSRSQQLDLLRTWGLIAMRMGPPDQGQISKITEKLNPHFPSNDYALDREMSQLLLFLGEETATAKSIALLEKHTREKTITHPTMLTEEVSNRSEDYGPLILEVLENMPPTEALYYGTILSHAKAGWTEELRDKYFSWFYDGLSAKGGMSFKPFLENIRKNAMTHVPDDRKQYYEELSGIYQPGEELANLPQPEGPGEEYNAYDIGNIAGKGLKKYRGTIEKGKLIYQAAMCSTCHRMRGEGGTSGPDLTQLHTRFKLKDLTTAIFSPNDEISDQYAFTLFHLKEGKKAAGKILSETKEKIVVMPNAFSSTFTTEITKSDVIKQEPSPISPMPPNLLNRLNEKEIVDLFAYILSGGDKEHYYYGGTKGLKEKDQQD